MDIAIKKIELIEWVARLQDESLIQKIEALRKGSAKYTYEQRVPTTAQDVQAKLDRAEQDLDAGRVYPHEEVEARFRKKFGK